MANDVPMVHIHVRVTREMAHEQVLKLQCELAEAMRDAYAALSAGSFVGAARAVVLAVQTKAQLRRIARWL